ncbi:uncharacterized protein E0L32_002377 [Thyridium curvatum]|uniref:LysM domain-containing protein n=1 Tax=Thyridium curvatum TaxID=1093900 RepID=A0A507APX0_9PEZI|nr:uncharacterized protein E0L32_002377 [Thyridium curvatum]TPX06881.1 hypothetical protein E0L32_002377 [Thyridium curvatum]
MLVSIITLATGLYGLARGTSLRIASDSQPAYHFDPRTVKPCSWWFDYDAERALPCDLITVAFGITVEQFVKWNPSLAASGSSCTGLELEQSYCVEGGNAGSATPAPTPTSTKATSTTTTTTTKPGNGIPTPTPTQPNMVADCDQFHLVKKGETCDAIAGMWRTTAVEIVKLNPSVGTTCSGMWADTYICLSRIGEPDKTRSTVETPQPIQPGMVTNCKKFVLVKSGQTCEQVAKANGITLEQFTQWNTGVGQGCNSLWANTYACVGV